jgi:hypothetical protein
MAHVAPGHAAPGRTVRRLAVLVVALVGAAACEDESAIPIRNVRVVEEGGIELTHECATAARTLVEETTDEVDVRLLGTVGDSGETCTLVIELDDPLGGRAVVDARDGRAWRFVEGEMRVVRLNGCRDRGCEVDWTLDDDAGPCEPIVFLLSAIGSVSGARGDSSVSVTRCGDGAAVASVGGVEYVWERSGTAWLLQSTLESACELRSDQVPVTDEDCALLDG